MESNEVTNFKSALIKIALMLVGLRLFVVVWLLHKSVRMVLKIFKYQLSNRHTLVQLKPVAWFLVSDNPSMAPYALEYSVLAV